MPHSIGPPLFSAFLATVISALYILLRDAQDPGTEFLVVRTRAFRLIVTLNAAFSALLSTLYVILWPDQWRFGGTWRAEWITAILMALFVTSVFDFRTPGAPEGTGSIRRLRDKLRRRLERDLLIEESRDARKYVADYVAGYELARVQELAVRAIPAKLKGPHVTRFRKDIGDAESVEVAFEIVLRFLGQETFLDTFAPIAAAAAPYPAVTLFRIPR